MSLGTVLVVDDEAHIRKSVRLVLVKAGYDVIEAHNGEEAIAIMEAGDKAAKIDAILCDLQMPQIHGAQAIAYFKAHFPLVPVVIFTGEPDFVLTDVLMKQGVSDYLLKPVSDKKLLETIGTAVRLHELRQKQA
jgi:DNA-binding NtrC family response regulator